MNHWVSFDKLVEHCIYRYGYFSMYLLSSKEYDFYKNYYLASLWFASNPNEGIDRPISRLSSELMSKDLINIIHSRNITPEVWDIMEKYTLQELKKLVVSNYYPIHKIIYKPFKKNWAKAFLETKKWSFNVFAIRSILNDDVLRHIKKFL